MKTATIDILGKKYSAEGETVREALEKLSYSGFAAVKGLLTVKDENHNIPEKTIILYPVQTKRLFAPNKLDKEIAIKQTAMRFE